MFALAAANVVADAKEPEEAGTGSSELGADERTCLDITENAWVRTRPERERAHAAYTACRAERPPAGLLGLEDAHDDCAEFTRLYQVARHYDANVFAEREFCSTLRSYYGSELATNRPMKMKTQTTPAKPTGPGMAGVLKRARPTKPAKDARDPSKNSPPRQNSPQITWGNHKEPGTVDFKVAGSRRTASSAAEKKCEAHFVAIQGLGLGADAADVVRRDCARRYGAPEVVCADAAKLFVAGKLATACRMLLAPPPTKPNLRDAKMAEACRKTIEKVSMVGLEGDALDQAVSDVCARELQDLSARARIPQRRVRAGCRFLAARFLEARAAGPVSAGDFCVALARSPAAPRRVALRAASKRSPAAQVRTKSTASHARVAPARSANGSPGHQRKAVRPRAFAQNARAGAIDQAVEDDSLTEMSRSDEDFLKSFASTEEDGDEDENDEKRTQKHSEEVHTNAAPAEPKLVPPSPPAPRLVQTIAAAKTVMTDESAGSLGGSDDILANFLSSSDVKTKLDLAPAPKPAATAPVLAATSGVSDQVVTTMIETDAKKFDKAVPAATSAPVSSSGVDGNDLDSMVSSFLTESGYA